ncbi:M23 family metallopeptidase [Novosphingobium sp. Gsoil 351]|uniref:M23 family metallopeptidase n=1 Tax=Novosphingobium sp. Gsoil 351 TaxID=2675225 RepID=UPI001E2A2A1A|nr:M23 family metallopeptidase [Novosphingobium sp. Gsoil 351]
MPAPPQARGPATFVYAGELTQGGWLKGTVPGGTVALTLDGAPVDVAPDGGFLVAFDRDAPPAATLIARLGDGRSVTAALTIAPRAWEIENVAVAPRPGELRSAEYERRRAIELAQIKTARGVVTGSQGWRQDFVWPAIGRISGRFGAQRVYRGTPGAYHSGIDIATGGSGSPYVAPADGVVILAAEAPFTLEGNLLMIDHGNGLNSAFLHSSKLLVKAGEAVHRGQAIGLIGMTGRATGPHLHWSLKWRDARLDPILFTGPMPPTLAK